MSNQPTLRGNTWTIENNKPLDEEIIHVHITEAKQHVLMLQCENTVVKVEGKFTKLTLEECNRSSVSFDNIIVSVDAAYCKEIQLLANGEIPEIQLDSSNQVNMYIKTEVGKKVRIYAARCGDLNVITPPKTPSSEPEVQEIPETFETRFDPNGNLVTTQVRYLGQ